MLRKTVTGFFVVMGVLFCCVIVFSKIVGKQRWNKDIGVDIHHEFNTAYVDFGEKELRRIKIVSWRDFTDSDQLQFTDEEGRTYLTGCNRVIFINEPQK